MMSDEQIVDRVRKEGACCIPDFLTEAELAEARTDLDQACTDMGHGDQQPETRARLGDRSLLNYPGLARIYDHPRTIKLSAILTEDADPFLQEMVANRFYPPFDVMQPHLDEDFGLVPPFMRVTWALFLDDISAESGALQYAPGTHWRNYVDENDPDKLRPTQAEIQAADYVPIELSAGALILRASDVWHCVKPIHHLRRYVTGSYISRTRMTPWFKENVEKQIAERRAGNVEEA
jgi:hypothetical protein